jgi:uncharacterized repeat protein (TIGR03803 family)
MSGVRFSNRTTRRLRVTNTAATYVLFASICFILVLAIGAVPAAQAQTETVLYSFVPTEGLPPYPYAGVVRDAKGNLYGTTCYGGLNSKGTIYKLSAKGVQTVLYTFAGQPDGANPIGALLLDSSGDLYGTTSAGGINNVGTVFELAPDGTETVLHNFADDGVDGWGPWATLLHDTNGNLYGTTQYGGSNGEGTVFELAPNGNETILHNFASSPIDGYFPNAELVRDAKGNLYGTTYAGGANGVGTVFKLTASGEETVLYSFVNDGYNGYQPSAGLVRDGKGNLYGTTLNGGLLADGTIFELTKKGVEIVLCSLDGNGGSHPYAALIRDSKGNLYGTAAGGGIGGQEGYGSVFKIVPNGTEVVLHIFTGGSDGGYPYRAALAKDSKGNLYGTTTYFGASTAGTLYKVVP